MPGNRAKAPLCDGGPTGDSLPVNSISVFQMIRADVTTKPATTVSARGQQELANSQLNNWPSS
jgi:hypothetical protein